MNSPRGGVPWRTVGSIGLVMVLAVSVLWSIIRQVDTTDVPSDEPTAGAATEVPTPAPTDPPGTPPGTPENGEPVHAIGSLPWMLLHAPDRLSDGTLPLNDIASYADLATWCASHGIATPTSLDDPALARWLQATATLAIPSGLREHGTDASFRQAYGFSLFDVQQLLVVGQAPDYVTIMRGTFDANALQNAWVASGYQAVEIDGITIWTLAPNDTIDLSPPESRPAMGALNNIVLLPDGTLIAATRTSRLESAIKAATGQAAPLAANEAIAPLLLPGTGLDELGTAVLAKGTMLEGTGATMPVPSGTPDAFAPLPGTPTIAGEMPESIAVVIGLPLPNEPSMATPATRSDLSMRMYLVMDGTEDALTARQVISSRLANDSSPVTAVPYRERIRLDRTSILERVGHPVVVLECSLLGDDRDWLAMIGNRDLGFAFWLP